ncbi:NUDIX hydrolase [Clostridium sp. D2Q-14]|uniref:NUDIX hydrolase n=1 Tax=Anaeromonas gelatinilytica TaxID=2683194 RepID=UPI00193B3B11|nr:NUDIX hydrolase [Anaeromonas gelatinilytica]MBS4536225.1 NUDIX hydrolase [Anaeromonas gelatinilytica]
MSYIEKTMKSEKVYDGKTLNLRIDTVELPDKKYSKREIVEHPGAVCIVPMNTNNEIYLVKQYRKAIDKEILEIPAGKIEIGEEPKDCAIRELKEETGLKAGNYEYILEFYTSPGFCNEKMHLFIAKDLEEGEATPDIDEYIDIEKFKLEKLLHMIEIGEINDSKTIIGIQFVEKLIKSKHE